MEQTIVIGGDFISDHMDTILQGTTPSLQIIIDQEDFSVLDVTQLEICLWQVAKDTTLNTSTRYSHVHTWHGDTIKSVFEYGLDDVTVDEDENSFTVQFTEADTMQLDPQQYLLWQMRCKFADGTIVGTVISDPICVADLKSTEMMSE